MEGFSIFDRAFANLARLFIITVGGVLSLAFGFEFNDRGIVVDDISVPAELERRGYTPSVVAAQVVTEWQQIGTRATTTKRYFNIGARDNFGRGQVDLAIPGFNLSVNSMADYFKSKMGGQQDRLRGSIVESDSTAPECVDGCYTFFLRISSRDGNRFAAITAPRSDIEALLRNAARLTIENIDPYLLANYYYASPSDREPQREAEIDRLITLVLSNPPPDDDPWGHALRGVMFNSHQRWAEAIPHFDRALALDEDFAPALNSRCWANAHIPGRADDAIRDCQHALRLDPQSFQTMDSLAYALEQNGQTEEAFKTIRCAWRIAEGNEDVETTFRRLRAAHRGDTGPQPSAAECEVGRLIAGTTAIDRPDEAHQWLDWLPG